MTFKEQITADLGVFFNSDEHAQAVAYNSASIVAVVGYGTLMDTDAEAVKRRKTIWVKASDVVTPAYRDIVVIDSDTWRVGPEDEHESHGLIWELTLYRDERPTL